MDRGAVIAGNVLDYLNRARANGNGPDIGAFEFYRKPSFLPAINILLFDEE